MRLRLLALAFFAFAAPAARSAPADPPAAPTAQHRVVLVSIDGMSPSAYLDPDGQGLKVPNLRRLKAEGSYARAVVGVLPTNTYPSHTTIVTGVPPRVHGILGNQIFDPYGTSNEAWYWYADEIKVPTLWTRAKDAGLVVGSVAWPVTVGAKIDALVPEYWRSGSTNPHDLHLLRALSTPGLVEAVEAKLGRDLTWPPSDADRTEIALHILRTYKPHLLLLHLGEHDHFQHANGVGSPEAKAALERDDAELGRLRAAIAELGFEKETIFVVVSDHGFLPTKISLHPNVLLREAGLITTDEAGKVKSWRAMFWTQGGTALLRLADPRDTEALDKARATLATKVAEQNSGLEAILEPTEIEAQGADPAITPLVLDAKSGYRFDRDAVGGWSGPAKDVAGHGYSPTRSVLAASFLLAGRGVERLGDEAPMSMTAIFAKVLASVEVQPGS